jgi:hypothetical protein
MSTDTRETVKVGNQDNVPAAVVETREQKKIRLMSVLDRGASSERLNVDLPPHLHGEWVPLDDVSVYEKERLGFSIDKEFAPKRALHSKGDGKSIVGDCVYMTCLREDYEIMLEIRDDQYLKANRKGSVQKEEKDFNSLTRTEGLETVNEGNINQARKEELEAAMGIKKD